jgi:hypothetical protein
MAPNKPIEVYEVGDYGELTARPNPEGLVVLTVPDFAEMIPTIEKRLGHKLTESEIEQEREAAPAIVLTKEEAEKMTASRSRK